MDKVEFIHKIKDLAPQKVPVKRRYVNRTIMGQVQPVFQIDQFCTSDTVDIPLLVHSGAVDQLRSARPCSTLPLALAKFFFENRRHWFTTTKGYTRIVVVVNAKHFLWISLFFSKKSSTWMLYKAVNDSVLACCQFWTNFRAVYKPMLVHNRYLWICRALSTGGGLVRQNRVCRALFALLREAGNAGFFLVLHGKPCLGFFCVNSVNRFTVKKEYTRIVVVVNARHFLWISTFLSTESAA